MAGDKSAGTPPHAPIVLFEQSTSRSKESPTVNAGKTPPTSPLTPRERRVVMWVLAGVLVLLIALSAAVWSFSDRSSSPVRSGESCVTVSIASSMGGVVEHECGAAARDWCQAAYAGRDAHAEAVQKECRAVGILPPSTKSP